MTTFRPVTTRRLAITVCCPSCEFEMEKTLSWLKRHFYTTCTSCRQNFGLERGLSRRMAHSAAIPLKTAAESGQLSCR